MARDLCDCIYHYDVEVMCETLSTGRVLVYTYIESFKRCLNMEYFSKIIKEFQHFDNMYIERPQCDNCVIVEIGGRFFVRWVK